VIGGHGLARLFDERERHTAADGSVAVTFDRATACR